MTLNGANDHDKFVSLCELTYNEQAVWFLNASWLTVGEREAEKLWNYTHKCAELDLQNGAAGNGLDEMLAHKFLEEFGETLTVRELRNKLREVGAIGEAERPKLVPLTHYLVFSYNFNWHNLVNASQGDNQEEIQRAQQMLKQVQEAFKEAERSAQEAKVAQQELAVALKELHAQEAEYNNKIADAQKRSEGGGVVSRNKAKAELAQLQAEDPLPLRRAKISTEAAVKRADKTKIAAEAALADAEKKVYEAETYLNEVKSRSGSAKGGLWWIERELHEAKKYMPTSKGGIHKK